MWFPFSYNINFHKQKLWRKKLENNIRIIGTCNPYRKKKENKNICGLTYKNNEDKIEVELVYLVNIIP